jgi:hypothetical protein
MHDFKRLRGLAAAMTPVTAPPITNSVGLGSDASEYETPPIGDAAAVAQAITKAGDRARGHNDTPAPKLSDTAEGILAAGRRRRAEV